VPFLDANHCLEQFDARAFDHIVVGAGAAGILIALRLANFGRRVLLLESGHFAPDEERQALNQIDETAKRLGNATWTRKRILGGTTTAWGGQSLPFSPLDFMRRDWVAHSGWPIEYGELEPWYRKANSFMGVDVLDYGNDIDLLLRRKPVQFSSPDLRLHYSKWAQEPNFLKLHRRQLEREVTVLYNAQLLRIDLGEDEHVRAIEIGNFTGHTSVQPARSLVLAVGGLETCRTLLLNNHQLAGGLGNSSGWVGRAFMEHPSLRAGRIETQDMRRLQTWLGTWLHRGRRYSTRLSAGEQWQRTHRLLNVSAAMLWLYDEGKIGPLGELRAFLRRPALSRLPELVSQSGVLAGGLWAMATTGLVYKPGVVAELGLIGEQAPSHDSYVALGQDCDRFGRRKACLNWKVSPQTWESMVAFAHLVRDQIEREGLGKVRLFDAVRRDTPDWEQQLTDVNHHMGGARMSALPSEGVVDPNLQVWGIPNLHVCSAAVFPTSSHSNPTLTVLALASRLAERLRVGMENGVHSAQ
jgi:choline dehydrogenase-like flavoprotein